VTDNQTDLYRCYFAIRELFAGRWHYGAHFDVVIFLCRVKFDQRVKEHPNLAGLAAKLTKNRGRMKCLRRILRNKTKRPGILSGPLFFIVG
jgi:hypothetical protein